DEIVTDLFINSELWASLLTEDHFRCLICADILKEPVSIPCGHNYCKTCIQSYWTKPTRTGSFSCPQCRKRFRTRPALDPNSALAKMVKELQQAGFSPALPAHCYAGPGDVACDFCTGTKLRAVKSCLTCSASYCETHVKQHYTVAALQRHMLMEVTGELEQKLCKLHHRALEVFCRTDQTFICFICLMEEHKEHDTVLSKSEAPAVGVVFLLIVSQANTSKRDLQIIPFDSSKEVKMEMEMKQLLKLNEELTIKVEEYYIVVVVLLVPKSTHSSPVFSEHTNAVLRFLYKNLQRAQSELAFLAKRFCRRLEEANDFTSDFVEVAALGRHLDLGMLYDCCSDSFSSDILLWNDDTLSSMRLSLLQPHTEMRILEDDSLQDRLRALDLTSALRASVVSGLVDVAGAAAFLKHPTQSELHDRVTVHYRTSTRLDMLSHRLLHSGAPLSVNIQDSTHVVVAVLYGTQAFFVFDNMHGCRGENPELRATVKKLISSSCPTELMSSLSESEQTSCVLYDCTLYQDSENMETPVNFDTAVTLYSSLQKRLGPHSERAVPLKAWLYPLKNLDPTSSHVVKDISEDLLAKAETVLEFFDETSRKSQDIINSNNNLKVMSWFPALKKDLYQFCELLQQYRSEFQRELASCIKTIREKGEEGEKRFQDLLKRNEESPFSLQNLQQWLQNKDAEVRALNECRAANITVVKSQKDLKHLLTKSQADTVLCFTFTSLECEDPFLSALKRHIELINTLNTQDTQPPLRFPGTSQKILSDLHLFLSSKDADSCAQQTRFIAASVPDQDFPGSSIRLYQSGCLVSCNIKLGVNLEAPEIIRVRPTSVTLKLQRPQSSDRYRVEYRAVSCKGKSRSKLKWSNTEICSTEESCVVRKLTPETQYQLRYAVMDSISMSNYSRITEFQTLPRARPGQPTVPKQCKDSLTISWPSPEADGDSPVLRYMVEYKEAGLEGWQSILTEGPECVYTITLLYSTCYRVRVSAVYEEGDTSKPSEEIEVPVESWKIDLSKRKASLFLEVLKILGVKKPVELRGWSDEESEVRCFLQCLPYISQLSSQPPPTGSFDDSSNPFTPSTQPPCSSLSFTTAQHPKDLNSYRPVALTSHLMKSLERLVLTHLHPLVRPSMDPLQFVGVGVGVDDAVIYLLHRAFSHLEKPGSTVRITFFDFSSAFNTIQPGLLKDKLEHFKTGYWTTSPTEHNTLPCHCHLQKFYDDSAIVRLITNEEDSEYRELIQDFVDWCLQNNLHINAGKTKELVVDFRRCRHPPFNTTALHKKGQSRLYLLRRLRSFGVQGALLRTFFDTVVASAIFYGVVCWGSSISTADRKRLNKLLKRAGSVLGSPLDPVHVVGDRRMLSKLASMLENDSHPMHETLAALGSSFSDRLLHPKCVKERYRRISSWFFITKYVQMFLDLFSKAAEYEIQTGEKTLELLTSVCTYSSFPYGETHRSEQSDFLLDLYSHVKNYETQTGRSVLPAFQPVYQSAPAVWIIDLSERKSSLLLEVLKLQTEKKPVELRGWSDEKSEVRSFLQCLPYISQLRFPFMSDISKQIQVFLDLLIKTAECERQTGEKMLELLTSVCSYSSFPYGETHRSEQSTFLLDLYSHVKDYETQSGRSVFPALQPVYQSAPAVWIINLSERKSSLLLEVLKLQTEKKPVELRGWSDEESEVRSFLQCLPYISQLSFFPLKKQRRPFLPYLCLQAAVYQKETVGTTVEKLMSHAHEEKEDFLLNLYSHAKDYEALMGRSVLPVLQPVYQSVPTVWCIDLRKKKASFVLEVLKLQTEKKPVELRGWSDEESEVRSFLQCLPYISQLSEELKAARHNLKAGIRTAKHKYSSQVAAHFNSNSDPRRMWQGIQVITDHKSKITSLLLMLLLFKYFFNIPFLNFFLVRFSYCLESDHKKMCTLEFLLNLITAVAEWDKDKGEGFTKLLTSVWSYKSFPFEENSKHDGKYDKAAQSDFLLDLYSHVKNYETQTGMSVLPALQPVYQSAPAVWNINLSERKSSLLLEVLKLQTVKKPLELRGWSDEESDVRSFLQCLPYISQLR
ncbi:hypothetical protein NFI96_030848, partial [Prochilodus magdalenae]